MQMIDWFKKPATVMGSPPENSPTPVPTDADHCPTPVTTDVITARDTLPISPPRERVIATRRFISWMQDNGFHGDFGWRPLPDDPRRGSTWQHYENHCKEERTTPLPYLAIARVLGELGLRRQVRFGAQRLTVYHIPAAPELYFAQHNGDHDADRPTH